MGRATLVPSRGKGSAGRSVQRQRFNQRQGFLVSAILHLTILMMLITHPPTPRRTDEIDPSTLERKNLVYLPPAAEIRKLLPPQQRRPAFRRAPEGVDPPARGRPDQGAQGRALARADRAHSRASRSDTAT